MFLLTFIGVLTLTHALPTPQILTPAATLAGIPATNHILILTPQAQVQLEPSLKFPQPLIQHLAPVARIDSPTDQTVVYYPKENTINAFSAPEHHAKQLELTNITNIVNQVVSAGQTAQAQLEAFQLQLTQGLEGLIQSPGGQKTEGDKDSQMEAMKPALATEQLPETSRQDGGRFYSVSNIPQFYSNFEIIHTPLNPLFTVQPYQALRARSVAYPDDKIILNVPQASAEPLNLPIIVNPIEKPEIESKLPEGGNLARSVDISESLIPQPEIVKSHIIPSEHEQLPADSHFGKYLGSLEKGDASQEIKLDNKEDLNIRQKEKEEGSELVSFAEAIPAGLAISGEGGLSQAKPIGSAIVGKDGVAYSAPSGTAIAGSNTEEKIN